MGQCLLEASLTTVITNSQCVPYSLWTSLAARQLYGVFMFIGYNILPLICFIFCYAKMAMVIRQKARQMKPSGAETLKITALARQEAFDVDVNRENEPGKARRGLSHNSSNNPWSKAKRNVLMTLAWVSALYIVCWTPQGVYFFISNLVNETDYKSDFANFATSMIYLNCCINPFVYLTKYEEFRQSAKLLVCCGKHSSKVKEGKLPTTNSGDRLSQQICRA